MNRNGVMEVKRLKGNPIIHSGLSAHIGDNINGPSVIKAPEWLSTPLGTYYLYFAHHSGKHIRMAYADQLEGPWKIYEQGVIPLPSSGFQGHIASPDVHIDETNKQIRMYFHGGVKDNERPMKGELSDDFFRTQRTKVAVSEDGLNFTVYPEVITAAYLRVFHWNHAYYGLTMPGILYRSDNGISDFEAGPIILNSDVDLESANFSQGVAVRHVAVQVKGKVLRVFYSCIGDCPEHIVMSTVKLDDQWKEWKASVPVSILLPEKVWEGGELPLLPSERGYARDSVRQLRDPAVFEEDNKTYLLYSVAGEQGIAIAELIEE